MIKNLYQAPQPLNTTPKPTIQRPTPTDTHTLTTTHSHTDGVILCTC